MDRRITEIQALSHHIKSIMKMQYSATHGNDPYVDDYYHQARLTKKAAETRSTHRFCPNKEQSSRPCVLLEFDPPGLVSSDGSGEHKFSQPQDGGAQLRQKWQILLEVGITSQRPKTHLKTEAAETITNLAKTVAGCISGMDLNSLSACLAAIVCSSEQPPLRPLGSPAGDGAYVILKSVLERPSHLLTDPHAGDSFNMPNPALWQASFDAVFGLLTKYCLSKYEIIIQSILAQATSNTEVIGPEAARAGGHLATLFQKHGILIQK
ncbi:hypothetical protein KY290_031564 [Solanum tuberosum]|uniref:Uncharacterized protein n=1 Tax=Solanum tuberosum TaxID=4113 RepID=A0ABQ7U9R5_SOLTU|nr:hypothetical protein KY285_030799 [Solanum tuberosum]KAH0743571.1 hypothetical protein KY290_031564 [Solanum tuberosum]